jgi:hypothetical protein
MYLLPVPCIGEEVAAVVAQRCRFQEQKPVDKEPLLITQELRLVMVQVVMADPSRMPVQEALVQQEQQIPVTVVAALDQELRVMEIRHLDLKVVQVVPELL